VNLSECSSPAVIEEILKAWPNVAKTAALTTIQKYGVPDEACSGRLVWRNNGPWGRTVVYAEQVNHNFRHRITMSSNSISATVSPSGS
jgi:hypothetical protein